MFDIDFLREKNILKKNKIILICLLNFFFYIYSKISIKQVQIIRSSYYFLKQTKN